MLFRCDNCMHVSYCSRLEEDCMRDEEPHIGPSYGSRDVKQGLLFFILLSVRDEPGADRIKKKEE